MIKQAIKQIINEEMVSLRETVHPDDLTKKEQNYKDTINSIDEIIEDLRNDIACMLNEQS